MSACERRCHGHGSHSLLTWVCVGGGGDGLERERCTPHTKHSVDREDVHRHGAGARHEGAAAHNAHRGEGALAGGRAKVRASR